MTMDEAAPATGRSSDTRPGLGEWFRSLWHAFRAWLGTPSATPEPEPMPAPEPPGRLVERHDLGQAFAAPAEGYVFEFQVHVTCIWRSEGLERAELHEASRRFEHLVLRDVHRLSADRTRNYPPHRVREAESDVQQVIRSKTPWRFPVGDAHVVCQPYVWLRLDEEVRKHVRPHWERMIEIECAHEADVKRARLADELSAEWLKVLAKLANDPLAAGAAKLTEEAFATVVAEIRAEHKAADEHLKESLQQIMNSDAGPMEKAQSFDMYVDLHKRNGGS
ncbi:hypothetical protein [Symbioplanes lichenis]|uniref:hypothetical protein n=1 Tax=Symbioplanes lichenis TaxID=1629072 RepID=UPI002738C722|nr:hypothetical protein [Actinoplanes lichenis]